MAKPKAVGPRLVTSITVAGTSRLEDDEGAPDGAPAVGSLHPTGGGVSLEIGEFLMRNIEHARHRYSPADGPVGGIIGGVIMGMFSMVLFPLLGIGGFWQPMNLIAALFEQSWGRIPGFEMLPVLVGMMIHLMMSVALGALFAWTVSKTGGGNVVLAAIVASLLVWVVTDFLLLPIVNPIMTQLFPEWLFALDHMLYGLGLGGYLATRGRRELAEHETVSPGAHTRR